MKLLTKFWLKLSVLLGRLRERVVSIPDGSTLIIQMPDRITEDDLERLQARLLRQGLQAVVLDRDVRLVGFIERPDIQLAADLDLKDLDQMWRRATSASGAAAEPAKRPARPPRSSAAGAQGGNLRRGKETPNG